MAAVTAAIVVAARRPSSERGRARTSAGDQLLHAHHLEVGPLHLAQFRNQCIVVPALVGCAGDVPVAAVVGHDLPVGLPRRERRLRLGAETRRDDIAGLQPHAHVHRRKIGAGAARAAFDGGIGRHGVRSRIALAPYTVRFIATFACAPDTTTYGMPMGPPLQMPAPTFAYGPVLLISAQSSDRRRRPRRRGSSRCLQERRRRAIGLGTAVRAAPAARGEKQRRQQRQRTAPSDAFQHALLAWLQAPRDWVAPRTRNGRPEAPAVNDLPGVTAR